MCVRISKQRLHFFWPQLIIFPRDNFVEVNKQHIPGLSYIGRPLTVIRRVAGDLPISQIFLGTSEQMIGVAPLAFVSATNFRKYQPKV